MERNPLFPLVGFALLIVLSLLSFTGYLLAARRLQTPPPPQTVTVLTQEGPHTLKARVIRSPEGQARGLGVRREELEALLYLFPQATDRSFTAEGYRFPVVVAFLDAQGQVLRVARLEPGERLSPGTAYRGLLEVREGLLELRPGDRVVP
ncbi:DUF192 domain-containing protein [Thermus thermamylovorans]|uniref:DUF192 domain-containing protein n=1 Tax=Thermus thermamylovorans TaxID=2509362 RepID=A0A4Q9AZZ1_9DEIN|nr:DUF192 domain-containing protein [Thermus thermamylovorans]TBH17468.1 DUF192 domain-containing protein [Thermus thermamylovorans]